MSAESLPEPSFEVLVQVLVSPCFVHLGLMENPTTGKHEVDLPQARWAIDLLDVVKQRTAGNLSEKETELIDQMLHQLRAQYMQKMG